MVINRVDGKLKRIIVSTLVVASIASARPNWAISGEMPTNPAVQSFSTLEPL